MTILTLILIQFAVNINGRVLDGKDESGSYHVQILWLCRVPDVDSKAPDLNSHC